MKISNFSLEFDAMEHDIRYALQPDNPELLATYISFASYEADSMACITEKLRLFNRVTNTLLDTICDSCLPEHWRRTCMDVIYRPVLEMEKVALTEKSRYQLSRLQYEIKTMGRYFLS